MPSWSTKREVRFAVEFASPEAAEGVRQEFLHEVTSSALKGKQSPLLKMGAECLRDAMERRNLRAVRAWFALLKNVSPWALGTGLCWGLNSITDGVPSDIEEVVRQSIPLLSDQPVLLMPLLVRIDEGSALESCLRSASPAVQTRLLEEAWELANRFNRCQAAIALYRFGFRLRGGFLVTSLPCADALLSSGAASPQELVVDSGDLPRLGFSLFLHAPQQVRDLPGFIDRLFEAGWRVAPDAKSELVYAGLRWLEGDQLWLVLQLLFARGANPHWIHEGKNLRAWAKELTAGTGYSSTKRSAAADKILRALGCPPVNT